MGIADGPTEVHKVTVARQVLKDYSATDGLFPTAHLPERVAAAKGRFADLLEHEAANTVEAGFSRPGSSGVTQGGAPVATAR